MNKSSTHKWPLRYYAELAALPTTPYWARALTRDALHRWGFDPFIEPTGLLISELVTNSITALGVDPVGRTYPPPSRTTLIALRLTANARSVIAEVWDGDPNFPQPGAAGLDDENGRGLMLVASLSARWSWYQPHGNVDGDGRRLWPMRGGKVTWLEVVI
jgi:hypothetical protein